MENKKTVTLDGIIYTVEFKETHIGDTVMTRDYGTIYEAEISDADDLNWIVLEQSPETVSQDSSPAPIDNSTLPNRYTSLLTIVGALQELIQWALIDGKENGFSIVDEKWTIYNTIHQCYNNWYAKELLGAHGIHITIDDIEHDKPVYEISYTQ